MKYEVYRSTRGFKLQGISDDRVVLQLTLPYADAVAIGVDLINDTAVFENAHAIDTIKAIAAAADDAD